MPTPPHSTACLYRHTLARLGLDDTDDMRVLFWDMARELEWKDDRKVIPDADDSTCPGCAASRAARG